MKIVVKQLKRQVSLVKIVFMSSHQIILNVNETLVIVIVFDNF